MLYEIKLEFVILGEQTDEWIIRMPLDKSSDDSGDISVKTQVCSVDLEMGGKGNLRGFIFPCTAYTTRGKVCGKGRHSL